ncbi:MAG: hypothetical protein QNK35_16405 [Bacteroides sp.]|nr:hypothetical protein [Bacteroides sp.]
MSRKQISIPILAFMAIFMLTSACKRSGKEQVSKTFQFEMNFNYPGDPNFVFDHLTSDISEWWDHSYSPKPYKLYIEPIMGTDSWITPR